MFCISLFLLGNQINRDCLHHIYHHLGTLHILQSTPEMGFSWHSQENITDVLFYCQCDDLYQQFVSIRSCTHLHQSKCNIEMYFIA